MTEIKKKKTSTKKVKLVEADAEPMVVGSDEVTGLQGDRVTSDVESRLKPAELPAEASGTPEKVTVKLTRWMGYLPPGATIKMDKVSAEKAVAAGKGVII